jgi:PAS domain S-box-containing protein
MSKASRSSTVSSSGDRQGGAPPSSKPQGGRTTSSGSASGKRIKAAARAGAGGELRTRAEAALRRAAVTPPAPHVVDTKRMQHELEVHRIELEMQNDELERARSVTAASLQRYTELYDFAPIGYVSLDPDGMMTELNHACGNLLGGERRDFLHKRFGTYVSVASRAVFSDFLGRILSGRIGEIHACEVTILRFGQPVHARLTATLRHDDWASILVAVDDVSEQRRAEEVEREASRRKDEFLGVLSHELRNPLAPMRVSLAVLERSGLTEPRAAQALAVIDRQVTHLGRLVDDLLDVARIASGKIRLQREPLEVGRLVRAAVDDHRESFVEHGLTLEERPSPDLLWVDADSARIAQVMGNLLVNAVKFTPAGGHVVVSVDREAPGSGPVRIGHVDRGRAVIRVTDDGVGIAPEMLEQLFQPFTQAPQALDRSQGGLGLGLAMVKALVEQHGGVVTASSEGLGRGAEIVVRLPLAITSSTPRATLPPPAGQHMILVIEDNPDLRDGLKTLLEMFGHDVVVADEGSSGVELVRIHRPSLVLCDIGLPGMNGYEVAHAIRNDPALRKVHLVALSGYARPEDRQLSIEAGFNEHISKPPSVERLKRLLAEAPALGG